LAREEQLKYQSEMDVRAIHRLAEMTINDSTADSNKSIMLRLLMSQESTNQPHVS